MAVVLSIVGVVGIVAVLVVTTPLAIVLHPILRLLNRRGTIRVGGGHFHLGIDAEAFRRG